MAFHVRDPEADTMLREFACERSVGLTEAIKVAVREAREARASEIERRLDAIRVIQDRVASYGQAGPEADKAFFDWLNDEGD